MKRITTLTILLCYLWTGIANGLYSQANTGFSGINQDNLHVHHDYLGKGQKNKNGNNILSESTRLSRCGLNYTYSSVRLGKRMENYLGNFPGTDQPAELVINNIPSGAKIAKAYIYFSIAGKDTISEFNLTNSNGSSYDLTGVLIGKVDQNAWNYEATCAYRCDVSHTISGNGTYTLSGLPTSVITSARDTDGALLIIYYYEPEADYIGNILVHDGLIYISTETKTHSISNMNLSEDTIMGKAFMLVSDLQNAGGSLVKMNNSAYYAIQEDFFDYEEKTTVFTSQQTESVFGVQSPFDYCNLILTGIYYQSEKDSLLAPAIERIGDTLFSDTEGIAYQWNRNNLPVPGAINSSYHPVMDADYSVTVYNDNYCSFTSSNYAFVGIPEMEKTTDFDIYPSITDGGIYIENSSSKSARLTVFNATGKKIIYKEIEQGKQAIDCRNLHNGVYLFVIETNNSKLTTKIIKQ
ncbi:MAG: hypothetical protein C0594_10875 [Marinilabiliales bacterium]|nr:MAG: hypothetical protein C0594_10875 [Marinilabiliales bacterium]